MPDLEARIPSSGKARQNLALARMHVVKFSIASLPACLVDEEARILEITGRISDRRRRDSASLRVFVKLMHGSVSMTNYHEKL